MSASLGFSDRKPSAFIQLRFPRRYSSRPQSMQPYFRHAARRINLMRRRAPLRVITLKLLRCLSSSIGFLKNANPAIFVTRITTGEIATRAHGTQGNKPRDICKAAVVFTSLITTFLHIFFKKQYVDVLEK